MCGVRRETACSLAWHGRVPWWYLQGTLLARLAVLLPPFRCVCFFSLAPAITLAKITWDRKAKVVYVLVCAVSISLLTPQGYKTSSPCSAPTMLIGLHLKRWVMNLGMKELWIKKK